MSHVFAQLTNAHSFSSGAQELGRPTTGIYKFGVASSKHSRCQLVDQQAIHILQTTHVIQVTRDP